LQRDLSNKRENVINVPGDASLMVTTNTAFSEVP
jgi:hypothetical protein